MKIQDMLKLVLCVGAISPGPVSADPWDKKTIITIDAPMQLPTITLQPGSYTLKLLESQSNRHIVTVWDKDGMRHITTVMAIPNQRLRPTGKSTFTTWETPQGEPPALRAWFYPGDTFGQEFAYPKAKAEKIAAMAKDEVPALSATDESRLSEYQNQTQTQAQNDPQTQTQRASPAEPVTPAPAEPVAAAPVPAAPVITPTRPAEPAPVQVAAAPQPEPKALPADQSQEPATLPRTASDWATVTLLGMLTAVFAFATLRKPGTL